MKTIILLLRAPVALIEIVDFFCLGKNPLRSFFLKAEQNH
jgi:hypothetical protein